MRCFLISGLLLITGMLTWQASCAAAENASLNKDAVDVGSRRELFVDDWLIGSLDGARRELHHPIPREIALTYDRPHEGNISYYVRVFKDGDVYRMYYRGGNYDWSTKKVSHQVVCYAESKDALSWTRPNLGLHEFEGSTENNVIWTGSGSHNFSPFKDENPKCKPEEQYKALGGGGGGLLAFGSPDGIHWRVISEGPVITKGAFDSQNLGFWDSHRGRYVDFHRGFDQGVRAIMTCTSEDFLNWTEPEYIDIVGAQAQHLYTNATVAYHRAPHIFLAFPKRFVPNRPPATEHPFPGVSEGVLMTSRDGEHWHRWDEAFLRPGQNDQRWWERNNHIAWGLLVTPSDLPGAHPELSLYAIENYYTGPCRLRRFTIRLDGFVSVNGPFSGGEMTTRPLTFAGKALSINFASSAAGGLRCEIQDAEGNAIPGYSLDDCPVIYGDRLDHVVAWKSGADVSELAGQEVRLRFELKDADLYSLQFRP